MRAAISTEGAPRFIGRSHWLSWLEGLLEAAASGRPAVVLVSGEPGQGKTRLVRELLAGARSRHMSAYHGRCYEDLAPPYMPFEALMADLERAPVEADPDLEIGGELIRRLIRRIELSDAGGEGAAASGAGREEAQLRLFLTVTRRTLRLFQERPGVLVLDDLHWAGASSLDLFAHLVFAMQDAAAHARVPLLLIATFRPAEPGSHLARVVDRVEREDFTRTLVLPGLDDGEVQELIEALGLVPPSRQLASKLSIATQGNPLFVQEALRHLARSGAIEERGGYLVTAAEPEDLRIPAQIGDSLAARAAGLSRDCREILGLASLLGEGFSLAKLSAVSGRDADALLTLVEEGIAQGFLHSDERLIHFAHSLVRRVFSSGLSAIRRQRLHARIATALEEHYRDDRGRHVLEIAEHLASAGAEADRERLLHYGRRAGDLAFANFAASEAARFFEAALAAVGDRTCPSAIADLHYRAGFAHQRNLDLGPCIDHYERAVAAYRALDDTAGAARTLQQMTFIRHTLGSASYGEILDLGPLEDALEALGESEPALRARIYSTMASVYWGSRQPQVSEAMAQRAFEIGAAIDEPALCADASTVLALGQFQTLRVGEALGSFQRAIRFSREAGDLWEQGRALHRIPLPLLALGRLEEAREVAREAAELVRTTHDWVGASHAVAVHAAVAAAIGDLPAAERLAQEARRMAHRSRYGWSTLLALQALACARAQRGAWAAAREALGELARSSAEAPGGGAGVAFLAWLYGQVVGAQVGEAPEIEGVHRAMEWAKDWRGDVYALSGFCAAVELAALIGDRRLAAWAREPLDVALRNGVVLTTGWIFLIRRVLGVAAWLTGNLDEAEQHFRIGAETARRIGAEPELARTLLDEARLRCERDAGRDRARATELVLEAGRRLRPLEMAPFLAQAARLSDALGVQPVASPAARESVPAYRAEAPLSGDWRLATRSIHIIFFSDMAGFTAMIERLGDARAWEVTRVHDQILCTAVRDHDGSPIQHTGDGLIASFPAAAAAIRAARSVQRSFAEHSAAHPDLPIRVRIAIHAGEPLVRGDRLFGAAVNATARMCDRAPPGAIMVSDAVRQLALGHGFRFEARGDAVFKGFAERFRLFEVLEST